MSYREPSPTPDLERRIERLEQRDRRDARASLGHWLFLSVLALCIMTFVVGFSGEICRLHHQRALWIEGNRARAGDICVCGRDSIDGGVIEAFSSVDGQCRSLPAE